MVIVFTFHRSNDDIYNSNRCPLLLGYKLCHFAFNSQFTFRKCCWRSFSGIESLHLYYLCLQAEKLDLDHRCTVVLKPFEGVPSVWIYDLDLYDRSNEQNLL